MNDDILKQFKRYLICNDCSEATIEHYLRGAKQLLSFIGKDIEATTQEDLNDYKIHLKEKYNSNSLVPRIAAVNNLMELLHKPVRISAPPKIVPNKNPLTMEEVKQVFNASRDNSMDNAILHVLYYGQLRRNEVPNLNLEDIDWEREKMRVNKGKGNRYDTINLHHDALIAIKEYLLHRKKPKQGHEEALFINRYRERISRNQVHYTVKRAAANAGIKKRVYPHLFRISSITHMSENGATMPEIQKQSRHKNLDTLQGYIQLSDSHAKKIYMKTIPSFKPNNPGEHDRNDGNAEGAKRVLVEKLINGEISEDTFKLALQTLDYEKPEVKPHEMDYYQ